MNALPEHVIDYYNNPQLNILYVPEGYANHGKRGKQPYLHIVKHKAKMNNLKNVEAR